MKLPDTATLAEVPGLLPALRAAATGTGPFTLDASALQVFDTSLLSLLLQARREAAAAGRPFGIVGAPPKLIQLAALYGVDSLLSLNSRPAVSAAGAVPAGV